MASSSSSNTISQAKHDVFVSFRGADIRDTFLSHLESALDRKQLQTFIDDQLNRGEEISPTVVQAIEESTTSVIIFSENYADSPSCLDELLQILHCKNTKGQIVLPVFYRVDPTHVEEQTGSYGKAFQKLKRQFKKNIYRVERWSSALKEAANISGLDCRNYRPEAKLTEIVAEAICRKVSFIEMASSSSSNTISQTKHDVFISFRGDDVRDTFLSHLKTALDRKQLQTFIDDQLISGEEISPTLLQAIEESKSSVIIFSENYADSPWCLGELLHILHCRNTKGQFVLPVFYRVDPTHVVEQTGSYGKAFQKLKMEFKRVEKWSCALKVAANISGLEWKNYRPEAKLTEMIAEEIWKRVKFN